MPLPKSDAYTTDYIYALPEGQRAELIDGQIYDMAPPNLIHQELVSELLYLNVESNWESEELPWT